MSVLSSLHLLLESHLAGKKPDACWHLGWASPPKACCGFAPNLLFPSLFAFPKMENQLLG